LRAVTAHPASFRPVAGSGRWPFTLSGTEIQLLMEDCQQVALRISAVRAASGLQSRDLSWGLVYYRVRKRQHARLYVIPPDPRS
jgi:hypothetical protein